MSQQQHVDVGASTEKVGDEWDVVAAPSEESQAPMVSAADGGAAATTTTAVEEEDDCSLPLPPKPLAPVAHPIQQIDIIVLDVSGSMKSRSSVDPDQTREDVSKIVFHTFVDKMMCLEMDHAVGLVAFGESVDVVQPVTRAYETFHDELGRQDARQGRTRLFDAIQYAAELAVATRKQQLSKKTSTNGSGDGIVPSAPLRVFVLTDGEDNASTTKPVDVARSLQRLGVVLDVFPMACANADLRATCAVTGGRCVDVVGVEQGIALFEDETLLHLPSRIDEPQVFIGPDGLQDADFQALRARMMPPKLSAGQPALAASSAPATVLTSATAATSAAGKAVIASPAMSRSTAPEQHLSKSSGHVGPGVLKRILKEYREATESNVEVFLCDSDSVVLWKVILQGPAHSPYEGGHFVLSVQFPNDYPFKPPKVLFLTPIYHCNVNSTGGICLDILKSAWSPALTVTKVVLSLSSMLMEPNADDPLDVVKAQIFRDDRAEYDRRVRESVAQHAANRHDVLAAAGIDPSLA